MNDVKTAKEVEDLKFGTRKKKEHRENPTSESDSRTTNPTWNGLKRVFGILTVEGEYSNLTTTQ